MPNGGSVDELYIEINSKATKANDSIDRLVGKLDRLSISLGKINGSNLTGLANGVQKLGNAMQIMNQVKTADFTRLASNLQKMGNVDVAKLNSAASSMSHFTRVFNNIGNISDNAQKLGELAKGITQLGYKSSTKAIDNIPKLAVAMRDLMSTLSKAPKVSQNIIDMTNALAKLARTGSSSGKATNSLSRSLNLFSKSSSNATKKSFSLAAAFGKLYASYWLLFRAFGKLKEAIDISSSLTEVQNVVDVTFGKYASLVEKMSNTSITDFGMSELTVKQVSSRFQAMGTAMGFAQGRMADMSIELTKLTADMASFYNVEQNAVAEDLASIFTGQTRPLRTYGLDLTEATLKEWAMKQGLDANIDSMSQAEKTMLRYQYVLANTGAAQGDFLRTQDTWANQTRILKQNLEQLGSVIGGSLINALKPLVKALNVVIGKFTEFAVAVSNSLGKIFGWTFESGGGVTSDLEDGVDSADGIASGLGDAADNAKKLKRQLSAFHELTVLSSDNGNSGGGSGGGGTPGGASADATGGQWIKTDGILEAYESELDNLYKLGDYISERITKALNDINWESVYQGARNFGTGLADFLNGLISPQMFGAVGKTIANSLNTAIEASLAFSETFDFYEFGESLAEGLNDFFINFDFAKLARGLNSWVDGLEDTIAGFLKNLKWKDIIEKSGGFLQEIEFDTLAVIIGAFALKGKGKSIIALFTDSVKALFASGVSIGSIALSITGFIPIIGTPAFNTLGTWIMDGISDVIDKLIPDWAFNFLSSLGAGISVGAVAGSWFPGAGTVAGAILGAIVGALNGIEIDGITILQNIINGIFNFDYSKSLFEKTKRFFSEAKKSFEKHDWLSVGKNIVLGVLNGIWNALAFIAEPIADLFSATWDGICEVFDINSPAVAMEPLGENILLGIVKGFINSFGEMTSAISRFFSNIVRPWFSTEKWINNIGSIKDALNKKWNQAREWWNSKPTLQEVSAKIFNIKDALSKAWNSAKTWWNNNKPSLSEITAKIKMPHLSVTWNTTGFAAQALQKLGLKGFPNFRVSYYASGGFPEDGWFRANHGEIMGRFDNGQSVVANNKQITDGIASAVYEGNRENNSLIRQEIALLQRQNDLLLGILEKETGISSDDIFRSVRKKADEFTRKTGEPAFAF